MDDDEADLEALFDAAGFATPPVDIMGTAEATLDVARLRQHLLEVIASGSCSELERESQLRTELSDRESLNSSCDGDSAPIGARALHSGFDVLRMYGSDACETLVVSFSGVSPGMGGISRHEFVGTCQRVGASNVLFVRGSHARTTVTA